MKNLTNKSRVISIVVSLVVLIAMFPLQALAASGNQTAEVSLNDTFELYKSLGNNTDVVFQSKDRYIYDVDIPIDGDTITSHIDAKIDSVGNQTVNIREGNKTDILLYTNDGKIYENGNLVTDATISEASQILNVQEIVPMGGHRIYYQKSAPYGKSGDYTKAKGTTKKKLALSKAVKNFTVSALAGLIVGVLFTGGLGIAAGIITAGVQEVISYFKRNEPSSKAMSLKDTVTVHKTKGFNVTSRMSTDKHKITYYHNENYTGAISGGTSTIWRVFAY